MSSSDWTALSSGLDIATVDRGVTTGIARPSGGGNFVFGFNSLDVAEGAAGYFTNQVNFAPAAKGVSITGCVKRLASGGPTGFAPFFFASLGGSSVNNVGYLMGLSDGDPYRIAVRKGTVVSGLPDLAPVPASNAILLRSTASYDISQDLWHHLRFDVIVNLNGDVLIQCFSNDLVAHPLGGSPTWVAIPGCEEFIDDTLEIATGTAPLTSGRAGFAFWSSDVTRRGAFDHVAVARQL